MLCGSPCYFRQVVFTVIVRPKVVYQMTATALHSKIKTTQKPLKIQTTINPQTVFFTLRISFRYVVPTNTPSNLDMRSCDLHMFWVKVRPGQSLPNVIRCQTPAGPQSQVGRSPLKTQDILDSLQRLSVNHKHEALFRAHGKHTLSTA